MEKRCFVAMPFDGTCDSPYYNAILPACMGLDIKCIRIDEDWSQGAIMQDIINGLFDSDMVVANITGANPNVYYELGISHALPYPNKTIMIAKHGTEFPFNIRAYKIIQYNDESKEGLEVLKGQLKERMKNILEGPNDSSNPVQDYIGYYEGFVLTQDDAEERHKITLKKAVDMSKYSLILFGTTLHSVVNQSPIKKMKKKLTQPEFKELTFVFRDPRAQHVSKTITDHILKFLNDKKIDELLEYNENEQKVFLYVCADFVRYSATYIDHLEEFGRIRITHSIYGSLMEDAPSYALTRKKGLKIYENYVNAWNDLKKRSSTRKISNVSELQSFRDEIKKEFNIK